MHFPWSQRAGVMGVINLTPDSFSDGGRCEGAAELPPGAAATVGLPCDAVGALFEGGVPRGAAGVEWRAGRAFVDVGAGRWAWNCTLAEQFRATQQLSPTR